VEFGCTWGEFGKKQNVRTKIKKYFFFSLFFFLFFRKGSLDDYFFSRMVEYNDFYHVRWLLKEKFGRDVGELIFPFLRVFIKDWHTKSFILWPELSLSKWAIRYWRPYEISFTTTEQFYKMRQLNFQLASYRPHVFHPPYSNVFKVWQKEIGTERARDLVKRYSYFPEQTYRIHTDVYGWKSAAEDAYEKEFYAHLEDVVLDFELNEFEKKEIHPPCTVLVENQEKFYAAVQKLRKKVYKQRIRKRKCTF